MNLESTIACNTADDRDVQRSYAWFVVAVLGALQIGSYIDRQIITLLLDDIRRDFGLTDVGVSIIVGFAFATLHSFIGLPMGRVADRYNRVAVIVVAIIFWSIATLSCMVASGYRGLLVSRMLVGIGEAALVPAAFSLVSDYFQPGHLGRPTSCLTAASFLGSGIALAFGGFIIAQLPPTPTIVLPLFGPIYTWQLAFGFASIPSLATLLVMPFVREPKRHGVITTKTVPLRAIVAFLRLEGKLWFAIYVGLSVLNAFQYALTTWLPTFFIRTYAWPPMRIGNLYGACFIVFGTLGVISGGAISDVFQKRWGQIAFLSVPMISIVFSLPLLLLIVLGGSATLSAWLLVPLTYLGTLAFGGGIVAIPSLAPNEMRGQLMAAYMLLSTLFGLGAGPWLVALYTERVLGDPNLIRYSMAVVGTALLVVSGLILIIGMRALRSGASSMQGDAKAQMR